MGDCYQIVVDRDVSLPDADRLAAAIRTWLIVEGIVEAAQTDCTLGGQGHAPGPRLDTAVDAEDIEDYGVRRLLTNGLKIATCRSVFGYRLEGVRCRNCRTELDWSSLGDQVNDAISEWHKTGRATEVVCPQCAAAEPVTEWEFEPTLGFGNLGFQFWNWPPLRASFVDSIRERLLGHRTILVVGKL